MKSNGNFMTKKAKWFTILLLVVVSSLLLTGCVGQAAPKVYRVGILCGSAPLSVVTEAFKEKMTELGYVEGENVTYDEQVLESTNPDKEKEIVNKFIADKVDLIFVYPTGTTITAKAATEGTNIPIVFSVSGIEGNNLVNSVREPGANITGVRSPGVELPVKNFEIMLDLVPDMKQLYVAYDANYPLIPPALKVLQPSLEAANVALVEVPVTSLEELKADLEAREASADIGMDAILMLPENLVQSQLGFDIIAPFAAKHNVPIAGITAWELEPEQGAVFVYGLDMREMGLLAAPLADKVLKGTAAGTIPVITPEFHLRINYKRAEDLGITIPEGLLLQAEEIIR